MIISLAYLVMLSVHFLVKNDKRKLLVFHFCTGLAFFVVVTLTADSPTIGGKYITVLFILASLLNFIIAAFYYIKHHKTKLKSLN
jgi:hypothetical protein